MRAITQIAGPLCGLLMLACGNKPSEAPKPPPAEVKPTNTPASTPTPTPTPTPAVEVKPLEPKTALHQIYGGDAAKDTATWSTDKAEVSKYPLHFPGLVDSLPEKLDFEVELTQRYQAAGKERTLVVFRAKTEYDDIYYGAALYEQAGSEWKLLFAEKVFDSMAQMEGPLTAEWLNIGPEKFALVVKDCSGGSEGSATVHSYYDVGADALRFVAAVNISEEENEKDDEGVRESTSSATRTVKFIPGSNAAYFDMQVNEETTDSKGATSEKTILYRHNGTEYIEAK